MDASRKIPGSIHDEKLIIQFKYRVSRKLGTYQDRGVLFGKRKEARYRLRFFSCISADIGGLQNRNGSLHVQLNVFTGFTG